MGRTKNVTSTHVSMLWVRIDHPFITGASNTKPLRVSRELQRSSGQYHRLTTVIATLGTVVGTGIRSSRSEPSRSFAQDHSVMWNSGSTRSHVVCHMMYMGQMDRFLEELALTFTVNSALTYIIELKQKEDKQGEEISKIREHFNPAMYKQVEDIREPICCALDRIARYCCVWGVL